MGLIQEIADLFGKLRFFDIVYEYQQGLHFRKGKALTRRVKLNEEELKKIREEERKAIESKGYLSLIFRLDNPALPQGWKRNFLGLPRHQKRYEKDKNLKPGLYFYFPGIDTFVKISTQERPLRVPSVKVPAINEENTSMNVECNIRYEVLNSYKVYTSVDDYEASLAEHTQSILAKHSRGKTYEEWRKPETINNLEKAVLEELRETATDKWGLKIHKVYVTSNISCSFVLHEGFPIPIQAEQPLKYIVKI